MNWFNTLRLNRKHMKIIWREDLVQSSQQTMWSWIVIINSTRMAITKKSLYLQHILCFKRWFKLKRNSESVQLRFSSSTIMVKSLTWIKKDSMKPLFKELSTTVEMLLQELLQDWMWSCLILRACPCKSEQLRRLGIIRLIDSSTCIRRIMKNTISSAKAVSWWKIRIALSLSCSLRLVSTRIKLKTSTINLRRLQWTELRIRTLDHSLIKSLRISSTRTELRIHSAIISPVSWTIAILVILTSEISFAICQSLSVEI